MNTNEESGVIMMDPFAGDELHRAKNAANAKNAKNAPNARRAPRAGVSGLLPDDPAPPVPGEGGAKEEVVTWGTVARGAWGVACDVWRLLRKSKR
jgi:hypothetical protein